MNCNADDIAGLIVFSAISLSVVILSITACVIAVKRLLR